MQELEKILEEMREASVFAKNHDGCVAECVTIGMVERILRKHMNDGWIPVEERLPEEKEWSVHDPERCCSYMRRMEIAYMTDTVEYAFGYYDGYKWIDKRHNIPNVVAWRIHKPYRPERSEGE